ncbi:MAG TPA: DUF6544 family protein [Stellaceae bacterium]|nr:DUF6544 family protein [Stellaceae bacterium]
MCATEQEDGAATEDTRSRAARAAEARVLPAAVRRLADDLGASRERTSHVLMLQKGQVLLMRRFSPVTFAAIEKVGVSAPAFTWKSRYRWFGFPIGAIHEYFTPLSAGRSIRAGWSESVVDTQEQDEQWAAAALRYLAELPWHADSIVFNDAIIWDVRGRGRIRAALRYGENLAKVAIDLSADGAVARIRANRPVATKNGFQSRAWAMEFSAYRLFETRWVPTLAEVSWEDGNKRQIYRRIEVEDWTCR